jgi:hypothetical protein
VLDRARKLSGQSIFMDDVCLLAIEVERLNVELKA